MCGLAWLWLVACAVEGVRAAPDLAGNFQFLYLCGSAAHPNGVVVSVLRTPAVLTGEWITMIVAMMFPLLTEPVRTVAFASPWRRRHRSITIFLSGYTLLWIVYGLLPGLIIFIRDSLTFTHAALAGTEVSAIAFIIAAVWTWAPTRRRALVACHRIAPLRPVGWRADLDCLRHGLVIGWGCLRVCWAPMAALMLTRHSVGAMAVTALLLAYERYRLPHKSRLLGYAWTIGAGWVLVAHS